MDKRKSVSIACYATIAAITAIIFIVLILSVGSDLSGAFSGFLRGAFGSAYSVGEVFVKAAPLILCGLSVACGSFSGYVNIGAEGQFYVGALITTYFGMYWLNLPGPILILFSLVFGFLFGGIWAMIPGILKAKFGISEVINTIMFNYIAIGIVGILLQTKLKSPDDYYPVSSYIPDGMFLPGILQGTRLHFGIVIAIICSVLVYILIFRTWTGYKIRAVGMNPRACECSGINVSRTIILSSLLSGGFAGVAGACEIMGLQHRLLDGISPGYGYLAIVAALLGGNNPIGIIASSIGIAIIQVGASGMQRGAGVPTSISNVILGAVVLLILARFVIKEQYGKVGIKQ